MSGAIIKTLRDLFVPNDQDTRCFLERVDETEGQSTTNTSPFTPVLWKPERLPPCAHLREDLPSKMLEHLGAILDQSYAEQVARMGFTNQWGRNLAPNDVLVLLQEECADQAFRFNYEGGPLALSQYLSDLVKTIYHLLTGQELDYRVEQRTSFGQVVSDFTYRVGDRVYPRGG